MSVSLASLRGLLTLPQELSVQGDEQLLAVLPEACIAADGLDYVQAGLVVSAGDRQVAEQPGQGAGLQLQTALQVRHLRRDRQRAANLPLRHSRLADPGGLAQLALRQPALGAGLDEHPPELGFLRCGRQGRYSLLGESSLRSIAHLLSPPPKHLDGVPRRLDQTPTTLYRRPVFDPYKAARHG